MDKNLEIFEKINKHHRDLHKDLSTSEELLLYNEPWASSAESISKIFDLKKRLRILKKWCSHPTYWQTKKRIRLNQEKKKEFDSKIIACFHHLRVGRLPYNQIALKVSMSVSWIKKMMATYKREGILPEYKKKRN